MIDRFLTTVTKGARLFKDSIPVINRTTTKAGKFAGDIIGKGAIGGSKAILKAGSTATKKVADFAASETPKRIAGKAGKFSAQAMRDVEYTARGFNNVLGAATNGFEAKTLNKGLNKMLNTNKFDGHRYMRLLKDSDESLLLGKRVTKLGAAVVIGGGTLFATKDAVVDEFRNQQGVVVGSAGNAPVNNYAYQGASYADNAGATGDLVLNMHRQRHGGFL